MNERPISQAPKQCVWEFDRYVRGELKAEGIRITREKTLNAARASAASLASPGDVLILRASVETGCYPEYTNAIGDAGSQYMQRIGGRTSSGLFYWHELWDALNAAAYSSEHVRQSPQGSVPAIGAPTAPAAPGSGSETPAEYVSVGYQYKFPSIWGGHVWRDSPSRHNGSDYTESREVFARRQLHNRPEVMNPPQSAAEGCEARNLNTGQRHGLGASPRATEARPAEVAPLPSFGEPCPCCASGRIGQSGYNFRCANCGWLGPRVPWSPEKSAAPPPADSAGEKP